MRFFIAAILATLSFGIKIREGGDDPWDGVDKALNRLGATDQEKQALYNFFEDQPGDEQQRIVERVEELKSL